MPATMTRTLASVVGSWLAPISASETWPIERASDVPYSVAITLGGSEDALPLAELTMLSEEKVGGGSLLTCAHKQGRKRSAASSRSAAATQRFYHGPS